MQIKLVRHAQSKWNVKELKHGELPNHAIPITEIGADQSKEAGRILGKDFLQEAIIYCSPYLRTRQTMKGIFFGAGFDGNEPRVYEDPAIREVDHGYEDSELQKPKRAFEGWFWYRFDGGESPADCYDRISTFLGSMWNQVERKKGPNNSQRNVVIISHGITIRCFVMRFLHLSVEQFQAIDNPENCDIITIGSKYEIKNAQYTCGKWAVEGLRLR